MITGLKPYGWICVAVALAAVTAFVVARQTSGRGSGIDHEHTAPSGGGEGGSFHDWLHAQLAITAEQEVRLRPIEVSYAKERAELLQRVESAGHRLAGALDGSPTNRGAIDAALTEIHAAQGDLQKVTIAHFLEMKEHLSPDQAGKLLQWTRESITHEHRP